MPRAASTANQPAGVCGPASAAVERKNRRPPRCAPTRSLGHHAGLRRPWKGGGQSSDSLTGWSDAVMVGRSAGMKENRKRLSFESRLWSSRRSEADEGRNAGSQPRENAPACSAACREVYVDSGVSLHAQRPSTSISGTARRKVCLMVSLPNRYWTGVWITNSGRGRDNPLALTSGLSS